MIRSGLATFGVLSVQLSDDLHSATIDLSPSPNKLKIIETLW